MKCIGSAGRQASRGGRNGKGGELYTRLIILGIQPFNISSAWSTFPVAAKVRKGFSISQAAGANFLCYVTPAEHLRLPTLEDMKEGIMASRIAAHAANIAKGIPGARNWDDKMSKARADLDWKAMFNLALDPEKARAYRASSRPHHEDSCTMCGKMCAVRTMKRIKEGKDIRLED